MSWDVSQSSLRPFFSTEAMAQIFSDRARIQAMLDVEAAIARTQGVLGIIPEPAAAAIAEAAWADHFEFGELSQEMIKSGNLAVPLVKALTALVAASDKEAARWVHWGATSQDIIDTGLVLQMREALALLDEQIDTLGDRLAVLAEEHIASPIVARTLMVHAVPTTLGLKIAGWLSALTRSKQALLAAKARILVLQFGGAGGNLSALAPEGSALAAALAEELGLKEPDMPWHTQRDRIAEIGAALAILTGSLGKMARDLSLMAQTEIREFSEPSGDGRGGSSAMPHKVNPIGCARIIAAAKRAPGLAATLMATMDQDHERGLGGWHAEWEVLPDLFRLASAALESAGFLAESGRFDVERMRVNLDLTSGLVFAEAASIILGRKVGKAAAHHMIEGATRRAVAEHMPLKDSMLADEAVAKHFTAAELHDLFQPASHLGEAATFTKRAVDAWRTLKGSREGVQDWLGGSTNG